MRGVAARLECRGPRPWDEAREWLRAFGRTGSPHPDTALDSPPAFAGFSFTGRPAVDWGLPAGVVLIPALEWRRGPDGSGSATTWRMAEPEGAETAAAGLGVGLGGSRPAGHGADSTPAQWEDAVQRALSEIRTGAVEKVVLARSRAIGLARPVDAAAAFAALRDAHPACYRFLYWDEGGALFLGASPERLVSLRHGVVRADAVAGTAAVGAAEDAGKLRLLDQAKDRREQEVVLRAILAAIGSICSDVTAPDTPSLQELRHLVHLRTEVVGTAPAGTHVLDLVARLHPTPAVAGTPLEAALRLIESLEPRPRGWYAGPIGWVDAAGDGDFAVGIRSALVQGNQALLCAGAGIVEGSIASREWEECTAKMRFVEDAIRRG
jgi:menaquinone-specific isochorismate synthase